MKLQRVVLATLLTAIFIAPLAFSIGLTPASVAIEDVLRGGYAEKTFLVYNTEPETFVFSFKVEGELAEWAAVYPQDTFVVDAGQVQQVKVVVQPPADAAPGAYQGKLKVDSRPQKPLVLSGASAQIQTGVVGQLVLTVTNAQRPGLSVYSVEANTIEERMPAFLDFELANPGNVRARPLITVDIADSQGRLLKSVSKQDVEILPTKSLSLKVQLPTEDLPQGDYLLKISVSLAGETIYQRELRQAILEVGALSRRGQLIELKVPPWVSQGGYAKIEALFRNLGTLASTAKLSGEILLDGKPVAPISSDEVDVVPGQQVTLTTYYTPTLPGSYQVRAAVLFGGKLTEYIIGTINVNPDQTTQQSAGPTRYLLLLGAIVAILAIAYAYRNRLPKIRIARKWK